MLTSSAQTLLALSSLNKVGPSTIKKILKIPGWHNLSLNELGSRFKAVSEALNAGSSVWKQANSYAGSQLESLRTLGASLITIDDNDYPTLLRSCDDAPPFLYVLGNLAPVSFASIAVIGTRSPTRHGEIIAERITKYLCENGVSIISGLALGCDTIAHRTAVESGGHTVAVLAHGLQTISPNQNRKLAEDILKSGGALVSQYPLGNQPTPYQFAERDKTQAGLSRGVVMIQSDKTGGSMHASRAILKYKRWLAYPYPTDSDLSNSEPKIEANTYFSSADEGSLANFLKCEVSDLARLRRLRSKHDYPLLLEDH